VKEGQPLSLLQMMEFKMLDALQTKEMNSAKNNAKR